MLTVYNLYKNRETQAEEWHRTVLSGERAPGKPAVHWEDTRAANVISSGLANADSVSVMIWFSADAEGKTYLPPKEYAALPPDKAPLHWTLTPGQDRIVRGFASETVPPATMQDIVAKYDHCITVKSVDAMDYGSAAMRHREVSGS